MAFFDHGGDGFAEATRWAGADDGVLVWDRNGNGKIDDGGELFGNNTALANGQKAVHGFAALSELDANNDGVVDSADANFANLRVLRWTDANKNGAMDAGEERLETLSAAGVRSLKTAFVSSDKVDSAGNEHRQVGSFVKADGTAAEMTDVWFVTASEMTVYSRAGIPAHSESIKGLPDMAGQGRLYNLRDAMALDAAGRLTSPFYGNTRTETRTLEQLVSAFGASGMSSDKSGREALAEKILLRWAGAEGAVNTDYRGSDTPLSRSRVTPRQLATVEAFMGRQWRAGQSYRNPAGSTADKINFIYDYHLERLYGGLMLQTHLKDLSGGITIVLKEGAESGSTDIGDYRMDLSRTKAILDSGSNARRDEFLRVMVALYGEADLLDAMKATDPKWAHETGYLFADNRGEIVRGTSRNDSLSGNSRVNHFDGDAGGDDTLYGKKGDDVYWLGRGTGHDVVDEGYQNTGTGDTGDEIRVKSSVLRSSVDLLRSKDGADLYVRVLGSGDVVTDSLRVEGYYTSAKAKVERVVFADGTAWGSAELGAASYERYRGGAGRDRLYGNNRVNHFDGDAGGNDELYGKKGDDVYWLGRGTGHDVVDEGYQNTGTGDTGDEIRLKSGVLRPSVDLLRSKDGADLYVRLLGSGDVVTDSLRVEGYYTSAKAKVERVVFADGTAWGSAELGAASYERYRGGAGRDRLYGNNRVNHFDGDAGGNDELYGKKGDDVYWLGRGTGHDVVDEGYQNTGTGDTGDEIRLKSGVLRPSVDLLRSKDGADLYVRLLGSGDVVTDSLRVEGYYTSAKAKVERVVFADGTAWGSAELGAASYERYRGGAGRDRLYGNNRVNHFDGDAGGNDELYGKKGDDVYWLGRGTGHDVVDEGYQNTGTGDTGDEIRLKSGVLRPSVDLLRSKDGADLYVRLLGSGDVVTDSLRVEGYYTSAKAKVERVVFADGTAWGSAELGAASYERYRGGAGRDRLYGNNRVNHFDGDAGGNDELYGKKGDDVYWLGRGTGHDVVDEGYQNTGTGDTGDKIRVKSGIVPKSVDLLRSKDGADLYVRLLGSGDVVTDSLRVEGYYTSAKSRVESVVFADGTVWDSAKLDGAVHERYRGGSGADSLQGSNHVNHFDGDAGGVDWLYGKKGNDVYWLGRGTGHDVVDEGYHNTVTGDVGDEIRLKSGIAESDVRWERVGDHLYVRVLGSDGVATDSLKVSGYYASARARVERVVFADGTVWGLAKMGALRHRGGSGADVLHGNAGLADTFDGDAGGDDTLYGYSGDDVYWLGRGTGHDVVEEGYGNADSGDTGDEVRLKSGIGTSSVRLERDRKSLYIRLLGANDAVTDSLKVKDYYASAKSRVERVVFADGTVWGSGKLDALRLHGTSGADVLYGNAGRADIFDGDAGGDDTLRGYSGDDVYWLGRGTGHDVVDEGYGNSGNGDTGDEIRVKSGIAPLSVRMERDGDHLYVRVLGTNGAVTDSLKVKDYYASVKSCVERVVFADGTVWGSAKLDALAARIRGTSGGDRLYGNVRANHFDGDAGGNDRLRGQGGDDVYWLGRGTGHDIVDEGYGNSGTGDAGDKIRVKAGIAPSSVDLLRSKGGADLYVRVLGSGDVVTDSLRVEGYYTSAKSRVESVVFADGTVWGSLRLDAAVHERYRGGAGGDRLYGNDRVNHFDGDAGGNDRLRGYGGDDVYWLGRGTGHDIVDEGYGNSGNGDTGDKIRVKAGIVPKSVDLLRSKDGADLYVRLLGSGDVVTDSLRVEGYYTSAKSRVESVVFADGTVWDSSRLDAAVHERYRGGAGGDRLYGNDRVNHFDGDAGGNDRLRGYGGDDVYWLGRGTGHDIVDEGYGNSGNGDTGDKIRVKARIAPSSVDLLRSKDGADLYVRLLGSGDVVTDSLRVEGYYTSAKSRVESVVFADGTVWGSLRLDAAVHERYRGGAGGDRLYGNDRVNHFDGDAGGNDRLRGYGGDDVYWLGRGTGHDVVDEGYGNSGNGDTGDKIRVKARIAPSSVDLLRSKDGADLYVRLLGSGDVVTDSLRVEGYYTSAKSRVESVVFADGTVWGSLRLDAAVHERYRGGAGGDRLSGNFRVNHFDGDAGGNDRLRGYSGDDVYWLGRGTGHDVVDEGYGNSGNGDTGDKIRVKAGIVPKSVDLLRSKDGADLYVRLLGTNGAVTDSLRVAGYYTSAKAKVESVVFADGTVWGSSRLDAAVHERYRGGAGGDRLSGNFRVNHFDGDAGGNDRLRGYSGDDVYWLGRGTGHDIVDEGYGNSGVGDTGDEIRVKSGIGVADVRLRRVGEDLYVDALGTSGTATDSLKVEGHYASEKSRVESIHAAGKVLLASQYLSLMHEMALFDAGNSQFSDMNSLLGRFWQDESTLATPSGSG